MRNPFKKPLVTSIFLASLIVVGLGGFFITILVLDSTTDFELNIISVEGNTIKGDSVKIVAEVYIGKRGDVLIENIQFGISSEDYNFNTTTIQEINQTKSGKASYNLTVFMYPLLNSSDGFYALNVGDYHLYSANVSFGEQLPTVFRKINFDFSIINPEQEEKAVNGGFMDEAVGWEINKLDTELIFDIESSSPLTGPSFHIFNVDNITATNSTWVSISQNMNLTNAHFVSFEMLIDKPGILGVNLTINDNLQTMCLALTESSPTDQIVYFENTEGIANVTLQIIFTEVTEYSNVYLDSISVISYEHRVFVVSLNDNWEYRDDEVFRKNPMAHIQNASTYFEKDLGIKLIPILELVWHPETTEYPAVHNYAKQIVGEQMGLEGDWEFFYGRSLNNHGFDFLSCFSNQTSDHYGFAFLNSNMAYHFAQSRELESYLGFSFSMPDEWAENIVQHEISHDFGALDRDRAIYPPSVMSKPYSIDQALADLVVSKLWSQVNNWLLDDMLLMLANRAMFD
ncbi:MAG: hypothetical protein KGD64_00895 [Candidatus Heimdallarchaeota archaeon]|nr:hypothetical protein [Candidatus Heimdallarchaeota archaeon]